MNRIFLTIMMLFIGTSVHADAISTMQQSTMTTLVTITTINNINNINNSNYRKHDSNRLYCSSKDFFFMHEYCCTGKCVQPRSLKASCKINSCIRHNGGMPCLYKYYNY